VAEHVLLRLVPRPVELRGFYPGISYTTLILAALAAGDVATAADASDAAWPYVAGQPETAAINSTYIAQVALARGDLTAARRWADQVVSGTTGWHLALALTVCARITIAHGEWDRGERGAHDALACAAEVEIYVLIPDILECLARLAGDAGSHREAMRLFGAAHAIRERRGAVRFKV